MAMVSKSVRVDKDLWQRARVKALSEGKTIQDLVAELLREYLGEKKAGRRVG